MIGLVCLSVLVVAVVIDVAATAWYARWQAGRLLALVRTLQPGKTAQAETIARLSPFDRYLNREDGYPNDDSRQYNINNQTLWYARISGSPWRTWRLPPLETTLSVDVNFREGMLSFLLATERQDNPGFAHPHATVVCDLAQRFEPLRSYCSSPLGFDGYDYHPVGTGEYLDGKLVREWPNVYQVVTLDERATPEERRRAYAFHLSCFTSTCDSGDKVSQPAPDRKTEDRP